MEKKLPKSWVETEFGNYIFLKNGYAYKTEQFTNEGIPILKISNITKDGKIDLSQTQFVNEKNLNPNFLISKQDILIAMSGATTGKYGVYSGNEILLQNQRVGNIKLHFEKFGNKRFVFYLIGFLKKEIEEKAYGGAQPNISPKLIEEILIPLPPLPEQERIVAKLDLLFAQHEKMKTALEKIPQLLKDFRQQILTQAVTGKLTEEWRKGKNLKPINENFDKDPKKDLKKFIAENGLNYKINDFGWVETNFFNLCILKRGFDLPTSSRTIDGNYVVATSSGKSGFHNDYKVECGIVVGRSGSVGKVFWIEEKHWPLNTTLYTENFNNNIPKYVFYFLLNFNFEKYSSSTAVPTLNRNNFMSEKILIPPLEEQTQIVSRVESLFSKIDAIELRYQKLKEKIDQFPQTILHKAFKGELVPQLPTDGDAKDLLKEILALKKEGKKN